MPPTSSMSTSSCCARAHQRFQRAEMRHQVIRRLFADIGNADCEQEGVQLAVLALLQLGKELCPPSFRQSP